MAVENVRNGISDNKSASKKIFDKLVDNMVDEILGVISHLNLAYLDKKWAEMVRSRVRYVIVNRGTGYEARQTSRSKQRCQDFCWKVHLRAQSFVLRSYTIHELRNQNGSIG